MADAYDKYLGRITSSNRRAFGRRSGSRIGGEIVDITCGPGYHNWLVGSSERGRRDWHRLRSLHGYQAKKNFRVPCFAKAMRKLSLFESECFDAAVCGSVARPSPRSG